jgi:iron complex outermembrane receptor protein
LKGASALRYGGDSPGGVLVLEQEHHIPKDTLYGKIISGLTTNGKGGNITAQLTKGTANGIYFNTVATLKQRGDVQAPNYALSNTGWQEMALSLSAGSNTFSKGWEAKYSFFKNTIGILRAAHIGNVGDLYRALISPVPLRITPFSYTIAAPKQQSNNQSLQLFYFKRLANATKIELRYNLQRNQREEFDIRRGDDRDKASIDLQLTTHNLTAHSSWKQNENVTGTAGIQFDLQDNFSNPQTGVKRLIPDYVSYSIGSYGTLTYRPNNFFTADAGLRLDWSQMDARKYYDQSVWNARGYAMQFPEFETRKVGTQWLTRPQFNFINTSYTLGLQMEVSSLWNVQLNLNHSERAPNAAELFSDGLHHSLASIEYGNLNLKKERSNKILGRISYQKDNLGAEVTPHFARIKNFIQLLPSGFEQTIRGAFPVWMYAAIDADFYGFDFDFNWAITPIVQLQQQSSWVRAVEAKTDHPLILIPPFTANQKLLLKHPTVKGLSFQVEVSYTAAQRKFPNTNFTYTFLEEGAYVDRLVDISTPPDAYTLFGAHIKKLWQLKKRKTLQLQITGTNLLDTAYRNYLNRLRFYADEMGRNVQLNLKYQF